MQDNINDKELVLQAMREAAQRAESLAPTEGLVNSVNGKGGVVTLDAYDVGALPSPATTAGVQAGMLLAVKEVTSDGKIITEAVEPPNDAGFVEITENIPAEQLAARKVERIAESKARLSDYLLCHPMQWTDGQRYAITAEKQQQLTSKIMSATLAAQTSTPYSLTWNATGEECQAWTLENLTALAFAIDARVTSLVSYQQAQEVAMREASTLEALEAIPVDYDSVPLPGGETA